VTKRKVLITGMGIISPVGNSLVTAWDAICNGRSGIAELSAFDTSLFKTKIAGEIKDFDVSNWLSPKEARKMDPFIQYGMAASLDAIEDSGLEEFADLDRDRVGINIGSGIGGLAGIEASTLKVASGGPRKLSPFYIPSTIANMVAGNLSVRNNYRGPNLSMVTACSSATHSIGVAARLITYGDADVMICGGAEYGTTPTAMGGFNAARALSTRNDDPHAASRPWDEDRDGFVLSNGAGIIVIESEEHARKRGARVYAELAGFGMSGDAFHMTSPPPGGEGAARCMQIALQDAAINPTEVNYINAHGTSTPAGDIAESDAAKTVFGEHARNLIMSSTKSMTGHLLGAAGAAEMIFTVLALRDNIAPPTINLDNPSAGCDLNYAANVAVETPINVAISNSFGFGGTNGSVLIKRHTG